MLRGLILYSFFQSFFWLFCCSLALLPTGRIVKTEENSNDIFFYPYNFSKVLFWVTVTMEPNRADCFFPRRSLLLFMILLFVCFLVVTGSKSIWTKVMRFIGCNEKSYFSSCLSALLFLSLKTINVTGFSWTLQWCPQIIFERRLVWFLQDNWVTEWSSIMLRGSWPLS